ncbi:CRISPR-associated CARF protein Csx1 [Pyrobaculum ferrireducens]|uniref:CRISPR-associated protein, MJ1666 family n=1 Tax=Pyrobaculum ferrireducens TaxID=1104324 RepID=G7VBW6_9CREN|nr:CRISPR-associated CARF protein Csx1 [Pyrobaculum ferrireducens]AET32466.1 CRISPR-associated protein, MJ1666 family [Pyrobaculum ferrireducens]
MERKMRFLLIAPWGNPPQWRKAKYRVEVKHPALRIEAEDVEGCSSTAALAQQLRKARDVDVLIFGMDTAIPPADQVLRKAVEEKYREWAEKLDVKADVVSLPGIGLYHGWHFKATALHIFNKTLHAILQKAEEKSRPSFIVVDLTHGVNYQTVAVLYAAVAASVLLDLEGRTIIYNSEPYPPDHITENCIKEERQKQVKKELPSLAVLDVTELQSVIRAIRQLSALKSLAPSRIDTPREMPQELCPRFEKVVTSYMLLASGAAALLFPHARYVGREPAIYKPGSGSSGLPPPPDEVNPDDKTHTVSYGEADVSYPIQVALHYLERELDKLKAEDLAAFLNKAAGHYEKAGVALVSKVLRTTADELGLMAKAAEVMADKGVLETREGAVRLAQREVAALFDNSKRLLEIKDADALRDAWEDALCAAEALLRREGRKGVSERDLRNLLAHGGFAYTVVREVTVREAKIVEAAYDGDKVAELIQLLKPPRC